MLWLHASMTALVSGLIGVVSTGISGQTVHRSPPQPRSFHKPEVNTEPSSKPPSSPAPKAAIERKEDDRKERRKEQQLQIDKLVEYIDERAAYYLNNSPIHQPYPKVDWFKVNSYSMKNLPKAEGFPVHGCPAYPEYYPEAPNPEGRIAICKGTKDCRLPGCSHKTPIGGRPFGSLPGFRTNLGIVAMPSNPVGGYIYTEEEGWVLYATPG